MHLVVAKHKPALVHMCACRYFIYLNWMPTYFSVIFGMDVRSSSYLSFLPWTVCSLWPRSPVTLLPVLTEICVLGHFVIF